jgi:large subunit ribosomal protein L25
MTIALNAETRSEKGKAARGLVAQDKMPAVVYGPKQESISISLPMRDFVKVLRDAGESSVIELSGVTAKPLQVLIHEVYLDPVTSLPRHADLYAIEKGAKVQVAVPLSFVNESPAVKEGASLVKVLHELEIEAAPEHLPHEIEIDLSVLANVGDQIHVKNIKLPSGVTLMVDEEEVVVLVQEVQVEEETPTEAVDMNAIEVEQKGKTDEEASTEAA